MSIAKKIKYGIARVLVGKDEALILFQSNGEGGGFIQFDGEESEKSGLHGVGKCIMENSPELHDFVLGLASAYLKDHTGERLEFSKRVYNQ